MIRLTLGQLEMAVAIAQELHGIEHKRDQLPRGDMIFAVTGPNRKDPLAPRVEVEVSRAVVIARLNEQRADMLKGLEALGIDFDPAG